MSTYCTNLDNLHETARKILKEFPYERVFGLYGEMGAGKTTLIKEFCKILEIENVTSSPTFSIINEYWRSDGLPVYHFDFYRIETDEEIHGIGFRDYLDSEQYCFIEWTEKVEHFLQNGYVKVDLMKISEDLREINCNIIE
jgi:tRNA threonylcarbamoyladenosine biosynthesis protein TsaE